MIGFAFACPSVVVAHLVSTCQESDIRSNIAVISNRYYPISMNSEIASDPTICANAKRPCIVNRPDDFGIFSDLISEVLVTHQNVKLRLKNGQIIERSDLQ